MLEESQWQDLHSILLYWRCSPVNVVAMGKHPAPSGLYDSKVRDVREVGLDGKPNRQVIDEADWDCPQPLPEVS